MNENEVLERLLKESGTEGILKTITINKEQAAHFTESIHFEKDVGVSAFYPAIDGSTGNEKIIIVEQDKGNAVLPPEFYITVTGNTEEEVFNKLVQSLDLLTFKLLATAATSANNCIPRKDGKEITSEELDIFAYRVERWRFYCDRFIVPRNMLGILRNTIKNNTDPNKKEGEPYTYFGKTFDIVDINFPMMFAITSPRYLGARGISNAFTSMLPKEQMTEEMLKELGDKESWVGVLKGFMSVLNPRAIAALVDEEYCISKIDIEKLNEAIINNYKG